jgi:hypothetical protein
VTIPTPHSNCSKQHNEIRWGNRNSKTGRRAPLGRVKGSPGMLAERVLRQNPTEPSRSSNHYETYGTSSEKFVVDFPYPVYLPLPNSK